MKIFKKKNLKMNNWGISLVELICAISIMSILGGIVSTCLIVSVNSYNSGTSEVEIQQEAQLVTNYISDLIIDAQGDVTFENNELIIMQNSTEHKIIYKPEEENLYYTTNDYTPELHLLANGVTSFGVDTTNYQDNGHVMLEFVLKDNKKEFKNSYAIMARNKNIETNKVVPYINTIKQLVLEPNEIYDIDAIANGVENTGLDWSISLNKDNKSYINNDGKIKIGNDEDSNVIFVTVSTKETDENGYPKATNFVRVYIRRVNEVSLTGFCSDGIERKKDSTYTIYNTLFGSNLEKELGVSYDDNYVNPYNIEWLVYSHDPNLFEIVSENNEKLIFKLKRDMKQGEQISVTSIAKHPKGENKTNIAYADVKCSWHLISNFIYVELNDGGMKRNTNQKQGIFTQEFDNLAINEYSKKYEYRFKEEGTTIWSNWYQNITGNGNDNMEINLRPDVTATMNYSKNYDIQIKISIVDKNGVIVWPTNDESESDYIIDATMNKVNVLFNSSLLGITNSNKNENFTEIIVQKGVPFDLFEFSEAIGYENSDIKNNLDYILEKNINGKWETVSNDIVNIQKGISCRLKFETDNMSGNYRVKVIAKDMDKYTLSENGEPIKQNIKEDFILYNEETKDGIFYFCIK